jgi:hypothetical protein
MRRREFISLLSSAAVWPLAAWAQQAVAIRKIGFLGATSLNAYAQRVQAFQAGLRELGYIDGKNIEMDFRWAEGNYNRLPELAVVDDNDRLCRCSRRKREDSSHKEGWEDSGHNHDIKLQSHCTLSKHPNIFTASCRMLPPASPSKSVGRASSTLSRPTGSASIPGVPATTPPATTPLVP